MESSFSPQSKFIHHEECNQKNMNHFQCMNNDYVVGLAKVQLIHSKECLQPQEDHPKCPTIKINMETSTKHEFTDTFVKDYFKDKLGGSQSRNSYRVPIPYRFDLIPPIVLQQLAEVYEEGAKNYGDSKYLEKPLPYSTIVNHMMNHLMLYLSGDRQELHLAKVMWGAASMITLDEYNGGENNDMFFGGKKPNADNSTE